MTCLRHTSGLPKPDFEGVAKELGAKGKDSCYFRHYALLKKWGLNGISGRGRRAGTNTIPASEKKRGRATTKQVVAEYEDEQDEMSDSENE